jgi:hypothetical protein
MCNLYSITTNQAAIIALFRVINQQVGNLPPMPGVFPPANFLLLMRSKLVLSTHTDATAFSPYAALGSPHFDKFALELSKPPKDGQHQPTGSGRGVRPLFSKRLERRLAVGDDLQDHQKVDGRAGQPIKTGHH